MFIFPVDFLHSPMKQAVLYVLIVYVVCFKSELCSQPNLIFNPSFEQLDTCRTGAPAFFSFDLYGWYSYSTADLYSDCGISTSFNVPNNRIGFQYPVSGNNYAGIQTYCMRVPFCNDFKEYITGQIISPLKQGKTYCGSIFVSLPDTATIGCNDFGLAFTQSIPTAPFGQTLSSIVPQIANNPATNPLTDKINWMEIKGSFVANGDEQFITIGNFKLAAQSDTIDLNFETYFLHESYYYIDDVSLVELKALHSRDTVVCPQTAFSQSLKAYSDYDSYLWSTGDTTREITITQAGTYWVTASNWCGSVTDTITVDVFDTLSVQNPLGADVGLCPEQFPNIISILPQYQNALFNYTWSTGSDSLSTAIQNEGVYYLNASHLCGNIIDTLSVNLLPVPQLDLGKDMNLCLGQSLVLDAGNNKSFVWNTGQTTRNITVNSNGLYSVRVSNSFNCEKSDSISINFEQETASILPPDTTVFTSQLPIQIPANNGFTQLEWNNGSSAQSIEVNQEGIYYLSARDLLGCIVYDTIKVSVRELSLLIPTILFPGQAFQITNLPANSKLKIYNTLGQIIYSSQNYQNNYVPIVASAMYFVELIYVDGMKESIYVGKLLVK